MILQKEHYNTLKIMLEENTAEEFLRNELGKVNEEILYEMMRKYEQKDRESLDAYLKLGTRYRRLFEKFTLKNSEKEKFSIALAIGEFNGIVKVLEKIVVFLFGKAEKRQMLTGLCTSRNYIKQILLEIYKNPNIRHKDLADKMRIKPNYLNELIRLLEPSGSVNKYAYGRSTYYELTLEGQNYVEEYLKGDNQGGEQLYLNKNIEKSEWEDLAAEGKISIMLPAQNEKEGYLNEAKEKFVYSNKVIYLDNIKNGKCMKKWG